MANLCAKAGAAAILAGLMFLASAAHACDERYPATCKPTPGKASSEPAESRTATSKPLQIATRRRAASARTTKAATAKAASDRSAQISRKRLGRKAAMRRLAARSRSAKAEVAVEETRAAPRRATSDSIDRAAPEPIDAGRSADVARRDPPQRSLRVADGSSEASAGFASVWKDRTIVTADAAEFAAPGPLAAPAGAPAQPPVRVASQSEVNEMDLAAADVAGSSDSFWLRSLFLALGGLLAVGSALRFLV